MTDETKKALEEFLLILLEQAKTGAAWSADQIPLIIQEKLAYDFWMAVFGVVLSVGIWVWYLGRFKQRLQIVDSYHSSSDEELVAMGQLSLGGVVALISGLYSTFVGIPTLIKIHFAPRLYIVEWLRGLV